MKKLLALLSVCTVLFFGLAMSTTANAAEVDTLGDTDGARCSSYPDSVRNVVFTKCYANPERIMADALAGSSWGLSISGFDAMPDRTWGPTGNVFIYWGIGSTPVACTGTGSQTHTAWYHDAHPDEVPSGGVIYRSGCGGISTVDCAPDGRVQTGGYLSLLPPMFTYSGTVYADLYGGGCVTSDDEGYSLSDAPFPDDWYPGETGPGGPATWCSSLVVSSTDLGATLAPGAVVHLTFDASAAFSDADAGTHFAYRFRPSDAWQELSGSAVFGWTSGTSWTFTTPAWSGPPLAFSLFSGAPFQVRCEVGGETTYKDFTGDVDPASSRPCNLLSIQWPTLPLVQGEEAFWALALPAGGSGGSSDEITGISVKTGIGTGAAESHEITDFVAQVSGADVDLPLTRPVSVRFGFTWTSSDDPGDTGLDCTDSVGTRSFQPGYFGHVITGVGGVGDTSYGARFGACMDKVGGDIGFNPSSWVPALIGGTICVGQYLLLPLDSDVQGVYDAADEASGKAPISYIAQTGAFMYGAFTGAPAAIAAHQDDSLRVFPGMNQDGVVIAAGDVDFADLGSSLTIPRQIEGAAAWLGGIWTFWAITRRLIR